MKYTFNGLDNFPDIRRALIEDAILLIERAESKEGHLADFIGSLETHKASIDFKIVKLKELFKQQKEASHD